METSSKIGLGLAVTTALGLSAYYGAEPIAKSFVDRPAEIAPVQEPPRPVKPGRIVATRAPITLTVGVDHTRSAIAKELPAVRQAIRDFLEKGKVLQAGDTVAICQVDEHASCTSHELPQDQQALMQRVNGIDVVQDRGVNTHINESIGEMLDATKGSTNGIIALWTDALEEGPNPNPEVHSPLKIVVPKSEYLPNADKVKESLTHPENKEVTTAVASTGDEFSDVLQEFTRLLGIKAQAEADGKSDADYQKANTDYQKALEAHAKNVAELHEKYSKELEKYNKSIEGIEEKIESVKFKVRMSLLILTLLMATGVGTLVYREKRPKLKGQIKYKDGNGYPKTINLPRRVGTFKTRINGKIYEFKPTRAGIEYNGEVISRKTTIDPDIEFNP